MVPSQLRGNQNYTKGKVMGEFKSWNSFRDFENKVEKSMRFIRDVEDDEFLAEVLRTSKKRIKKLKKGTILYRAQIGHDWRTINIGNSEEIVEEEIPCGFSPDRMKPHTNKAYEGRANPKGIPYLYLASAEDTAMAETRPWIGSLVSCAQFKVKKDLELIDLSIHADKSFVLYFEEPTSALREDAVWNHIDQAFSKPIKKSDDTASYVSTQLIAELFKSKGMSGISYRSALIAGGINFALFDLKDADLINCTLFEVESINPVFKQTDNPYFITKE
jgi:hypothetical protein